MATDWSSMSTNQLKAELTERKLSTAGKKKTDLIARLEEYEKAGENEAMADKKEVKTLEENDKSALNDSDEDVVIEEEEIIEEDEEENDDEKIKSDKADENQSDVLDYSKSAIGYVIALDDGSKIVIPSKDTMKHDILVHNQPKTVIVYPVTIDDVTSNVFKPYLEACVQLQITFQERNHSKEKSTNGYIEFVWASVEQAAEQTELLSGIREDLKVKHLTMMDKKSDVLADLPVERIDTSAVLQRFLYIGNLPQEASEEDLHALFPDATTMQVIRNKEGKPKGYALAEMPNEPACERATQMYMNAEFMGRNLVVLHAWQKPPKGMLDNDTRVELLKLVKQCSRDIRHARLDNDLLKKAKKENEMSQARARLDKDREVRNKIGLPVPPDVVRRKEREEQAAKEKQTPEKKSSPKKTPVSSTKRPATTGSIRSRRPVSGVMHGVRGYGNQAYSSAAYRGASQGYAASQGYGAQGYGSQAYASDNYGNRGYGSQAYGSQGYGNRATDEGTYRQAVQMLTKVSQILSQEYMGQGQQSRSYGNSAGYSGYGSGSGSGNYSGAGYGYGSGGMQRRW